MPLLDPATYQDFSQQGDPLADQVVIALRRDGERQRDMLTQVQEFARTRGGVYQAFMDQVNTVPDWVDVSDVEQGQALFLRCAPLSIASFVLGSLLLTYTPPGSARVLMHTGRLHKDVTRRLYETASMVDAILTPGGLAVGQAGHQAILRVRLLHAMVRQGVLGKGQWPADALGQPINQLQLSLTALGFSCVIIRSLRRLGVHVSEREAQAYQKLWRYANHLQGVDLRLQPDSIEAEEALLADYQGSLIAPDDNASTLVASIFDALAWKAPFHMPRAVLEATARRLLGPTLSDALHIPRRPVWGAVLGAAALMHRLTAVRYVIPGWRAMDIRVGRRYFSGLIAAHLTEQPAYQQGPAAQKA